MRDATDDVSAELQGFKRSLRQDIAVDAAGSLTLDFTLETGAVTEEVTVTAEAPVLQTDSALRKTIENAIECMKLDGTIAKMHEKWFGIKPAPGSAAVTVFPGYGVPGMPGYDPAEHKPECG